MTIRHSHSDYRARRGTVLIIAMIIVFALASMVLVLGRSMRVEAMASANTVADIQAEEIARGAERYVLAVAALEKDAVFELPEESFAAVPLGTGGFWVLRPDYGDPDLPAFGLVDEAGKLDINSITSSQGGIRPRDAMVDYLNIPDDVAGAIIDWRDNDSEPVDFGAEDESYRDYLPRNARLENVEDLLHVHGMTRTLLYGDGSALPLGMLANQRQGNLDTGRAPGRGLIDYVSVYAMPHIKAADDDESTASERRMSINNGNAQYGRAAIRAYILANFPADRAEEMVDQFPSNDSPSIFAFWQRTKFAESDDEFDQLADHLTSLEGENPPTYPRRINVNTAPREVLATLIGIGGFDENDLETLITARSSQLRSTAAVPGGIAWVYRALKEKADPIAEFITGKSSRYSADILAVTANGRAFKRVRIVIDVSTDTPKVLYRRDVTDWGWPMDPQLLAAMRAGEFQFAGSQVYASATGMSSMRGVTR